MAAQIDASAATRSTESDSVHLRCIDADGKPVPGAEVHLTKLNPSDFPSKPEDVAAQTRQRVLRLQNAVQTMRNGEQNAVAHGDADLLVDLFEAIDIEIGRAHV